MTKLLLLLIPLCAVAVDWDTQQASPHTAVVQGIGTELAWVPGDSAKTSIVGVGVVVIPPDTLRQIRVPEGSAYYVLYPWLAVGDTIRFDRRFAVYYYEMWVVPLDAVISKNNQQTKKEK
jgi:hypothetical protein